MAASRELRDPAQALLYERIADRGEAEAIALALCFPIRVHSRHSRAQRIRSPRSRARNPVVIKFPRTSTSREFAVTPRNERSDELFGKLPKRDPESFRGAPQRILRL